LTFTTPIAAPPERCFDLARNMDLHARSMAHTAERVVAGKRSGLLEPGEEVTFEGRYFGLRWQFTVKITAFEPPRHFRDTMVRGPFASFVHEHVFEAAGSHTVMTDRIAFRSPLGPLGWLVDGVVLSGYLRRVLARRFRMLREEAERAGRDGSGTPG
jgi:ligand-binding SRPBCC domain-containing protein